MASNRQSLREYIVQQARAEFPDAFTIVADPNLYTFRSETAKHGEAIDILQIGLYDLHKNTRDRKPLWAYTDGNKPDFFWEKDSELLELTTGTLKLYPDSGATRHRVTKAPFSLVAPQVWPSKQEEKTAARELSRGTLESLIKFAFILSGREVVPAHGDPGKLLTELQELCNNLKQNQHAKNKVSTKGARDEEEEDDGEYGGSWLAQPRQRRLPPTRGQIPMSTYHTRTKRHAEEMEGTSSSHGFRKTRDGKVDSSPSLSPSGGHGDMRPPIYQSAPSSVAHSKLFDDLAQAILAPKTEEWSKEKAELQAQIANEQEKSRLLMEELDAVMLAARQRR